MRVRCDSGFRPPHVQLFRHVCPTPATPIKCTLCTKQRTPLHRIGPSRAIDGTSAIQALQSCTLWTKQCEDGTPLRWGLGWGGSGGVGIRQKTESGGWGFELDKKRIRVWARGMR